MSTYLFTFTENRFLILGKVATQKKKMTGP